MVTLKTRVWEKLIPVLVDDYVLFQDFSDIVTAEMP